MSKKKTKHGPIRYTYFDNSSAFENWQNLMTSFSVLAIQPVSKEHIMTSEHNSKWWQFWSVKGSALITHKERIFVTYREVI